MSATVFRLAGASGSAGAAPPSGTPFLSSTKPAVAAERARARCAGEDTLLAKVTLLKGTGSGMPCMRADSVSNQPTANSVRSSRCSASRMRAGVTAPESTHACIVKGYSPPNDRSVPAFIAMHAASCAVAVYSWKSGPTSVIAKSSEMT